MNTVSLTDAKAHLRDLVAQADPASRSAFPGAASFIRRMRDGSRY